MNRKERRANPDQWWKLVAYSDGKVGHELPEQFAQHVKGTIGDIIVVAVPSALPPAERVAWMQSIRESFAMAGLTQNVIVVPDSVKLCRFRPVVSEAEAKALDRQVQRSSLGTQMRMNAADKKPDPS